MITTLITKHNSSCPSNNHEDTIARTTQELEELTNEDLEHLHRRALAFVICGKFESALEDASTMVSLSPSSALPYLCMGHVYAQQGRYGAAIHVYDQGLQAVSSIDQQQQLSKARFIAQSHNDVRIDFIKRLPTHAMINKMMEHILLPKETTIQTNQLYEYLNVSRVWRDRIMQCLPKDLHLELKHHDGLARMDYLLGHAAAASRVIALTVKCVVTHPQSLFPSISHFSSLCSLCIEKMSHDAPHPILALLSPLASTLEHLDMRSDNYEHFSLGDILSTFPQLTWLRCHGNMGDMDSAPIHCPKLKTLLFWMPDNVLHYDHIMDLTIRLPELIQLAIHPCIDTRALASIHENCPHLKSLYYNSINPTSSISNLGLESYEQEDGIESLHLGYQSDKRMRVDIQHLVSFLKRHHHSLQHLDLCYLLTDSSITNFGDMVRDDDDDDDEGALFESLRSYSHKLCSNEDLLFSRWLAKRSPHLKKVVLQEEKNGSTSVDDLGPLFDDLGYLDELEYLRVDIGCERVRDGACHFLQHHSKIDSLLHTLVFPKNFHVGLKTSDLLGSLSRLERLSMLMYDASNLNGLQEGCPRLRHLTVYSAFDMIGFKMALGLASLTRLRTLCIQARLFEYALLPCFKELHQLQELTICREDNNDPVDPAYLEMLPFTVRVLKY